MDIDTRRGQNRSHVNGVTDQRLSPTNQSIDLYPSQLDMGLHHCKVKRNDTEVETAPSRQMMTPFLSQYNIKD